MDGIPQLPNTVRFFVDPASIDAGSTTDAELIHQWQRVLRLRIGADLLLLDGAGMQVHVVLTELSPKIARFEKRITTPASGEPTQHITLCAALIRPERFEWLLQKSVELGVSRIVPLLCERTRVEAPVTANKQTRWQRIVTEAAEQSCRGKLPVLSAPLRLTNLSMPPTDQVFWLHEGLATRPLRLLVPPLAAPVWIVSGPEGGFSPTEQQWMHQQSGWHAAGLGARILRAETAPLVAATLVLAARGAFDDGAP
jgi:16S rRNA (uracil1498-N3)-methyltransferase